MMFLIVNGLVIMGICLLTTSLFPIFVLIRQLPAGNFNKRWNILLAFTVLFIAGYIFFAATNWNSYKSESDLVVSAVFFLGAVFVLVVSTLALQTIKNIKYISALEYENITDPLTGIQNRRYFDRRLREEIARSHRYHLQLSMLLLDVDHFKNINDTCGHHTGDLVLKKLGQLIQNNVREMDIAARYGGEEIAVIAPNTPPDSAGILAERLRKTIETSTMVPAKKNKGQKAVTVTVSIGVAGLDERIIDSDIFIELADKALYEAKEKGRNQVVVSGT